MYRITIKSGASQPVVIQAVVDVNAANDDQADEDAHEFLTAMYEIGWADDTAYIDSITRIGEITHNP